jgi:hypothetical protein
MRCLSRRIRGWCKPSHEPSMWSRVPRRVHVGEHFPTTLLKLTVSRTPWLVTRRRTCPICKGDVVRSFSQDDHDRDSSPLLTPRLSDNEGVVDALQIQAAETHDHASSSSQPLPVSAPEPTDYPAGSGSDHDVEANWPEEDAHRNARDIPGSRVSELSTSVRELSSTVSTVIWRGFEAVRSTASLQRRSPPEGVDRDR